MNSVLFIGNFLFRSRGSHSVSEFIANELENEGLTVYKASHAENRVVRLAQIIYHTAFKKYSLLHIDVFSGKSFFFARITARIGKMRSKKIILTLHGGALHEYYHRREIAFKKLFQNAYVQTPSNYLKLFFEQRNFQITYSPNPVVLANFPYLRKEIKPFSILWVRAFTEIYNPKIAVLVLQKVLEEFPEATLTMIGPDKGMRKATEQLTNQLNVSHRVVMPGPVSNDKLYEYYQSHAVYINTTSYESFGGSVMEAASCGVPIVSFSVGEIPYLWTDEANILLCDLGDIDKMTVQVKRILTDTNLGTRLSTNARERAEDFSWHKIKNHWLELMKK